LTPYHCFYFRFPIGLYASILEAVIYITPWHAMSVGYSLHQAK
jgi:hypothetical protein